MLIAYSKMRFEMFSAPMSALDQKLHIYKLINISRDHNILGQLKPKISEQDTLSTGKHKSNCIRDT